MTPLSASVLPPDAYAAVLKPPLMGRDPRDDNHVFVTEGVLRPGAREVKSFFLPNLQGITVLLIRDAGVRCSFRSPRGEVFVPGETKDRPGFQSSGSDSGISGFTIERPESGTWTLTAEATGPGASSSYGIDMRSEGLSEELAHLETMTRESDANFSFLAKPGDPVFVRVYVTSGDHVVRGVRWDVRAVTPSASPISIPVFDDGRHADGRADDGVAVGGIAAEGPDGFYEVRAAGRCLSGAEYVVTGRIEVQAQNDLLIADTIAVSPASPKAGEPVTLTVTAKNEGTVDSQGVELEFFLWERKVSSQKFDLKAGESRVIATTWTPPAPNDYHVMLSISPFLEPYASNFENNTRKAVVRVR